MIPIRDSVSLISHIMAPVSAFLAAMLAGGVVAYPGMRNAGVKNKAFGRSDAVVKRSPQASSTSSASSASSTYPAWQPAQSGEGM